MVIDAGGVSWHDVNSGAYSAKIAPEKLLTIDVDFVRAGTQSEGDFELRDRRGFRVYAVRRLLEPTRNFSEVKGFELIGIEPSEANVPSLWTPNSEITW